MICVNKVWKLIGYTYGVMGDPGEEDIFESLELVRKLNFTEINYYLPKT